MQLATYITYKDIKGIDISYKESIFYIKYIFQKYKRELILSFLGYLGVQLGLKNGIEISNGIQLKFGIKINGFLIHSRSILVLNQIFYETKQFNDQDESSKITSNDIFNLFLYANQILTKTDTPTSGYKDGIITIGSLMTAMRMHIGLITPFELRLIEEIFKKFYNNLVESEKYKIFNDIIIQETGITINKFIEILDNFEKRISVKGIFELYDKFSVLRYEDIYLKWDNRIPLIKIPLDYRFMELFPLIKRNDNYYVASAVILFMSTARKIYHVLSANNKTKDYFRSFWGKYIVEPVMKEYIKEIFGSDEVRIIDIDFQKVIGEEIADIIIIHGDDIYLLEIKSGYMSLESRFSDDEILFKENFEKKYILNTSGKHQLLNQLDIFENKYDIISKICELDKSTKYKVFSSLVVFDEAMSMLGFKRYLSKVFNDNLKPKLSGYTKFNPFLYSNLLTFVEILSFERRIKNKKNRIYLLKALFNYHDSLWDFLDDIKDNKIKVDGISKDDID